MVIRLALASGIPPAVWAEEGEQAIVTALEELDEARRAQQRQMEQMSG